MSAAREAHDRLLASGDAKSLADAALAFGRASRAVRQTIALQAKLARARTADARRMAADAREETKTRTHQRKAQVRAAMERIIWTECESDDAEALVDSLDDLLSESALYDGFAEGEVEAHIAHIREALGLSAEIIP